MTYHEAPQPAAHLLQFPLLCLRALGGRRKLGPAEGRPRGRGPCHKGRRRDGRSGRGDGSAAQAPGRGGGGALPGGFLRRRPGGVRPVPAGRAACTAASPRALLRDRRQRWARRGWLLRAPRRWQRRSRVVQRCCSRRGLRPVAAALLKHGLHGNCHGHSGSGGCRRPRRPAEWGPAAWSESERWQHNGRARAEQMVRLRPVGSLVGHSFGQAAAGAGLPLSTGSITGGFGRSSRGEEDRLAAVTRPAKWGACVRGGGDRGNSYPKMVSFGRLDPPGDRVGGGRPPHPPARDGRLVQACGRPRPVVARPRARSRGDRRVHRKERAAANARTDVHMARVARDGPPPPPPPFRPPPPFPPFRPLRLPKNSIPYTVAAAAGAAPRAGGPAVRPFQNRGAKILWTVPLASTISDLCVCDGENARNTQIGGPKPAAGSSPGGVGSVAGGGLHPWKCSDALGFCDLGPAPPGRPPDGARVPAFSSSAKRYLSTPTTAKVYIDQSIF